MLDWAIKLESIKLSSEPESTRTDRGKETCDHDTVPLTNRRGGDNRIEEWLTSAPPVADEPPLLAKQGSDPSDDPPVHSTYRASGDDAAVAPWE